MPNSRTSSRTPPRTIPRARSGRATPQSAAPDEASLRSWLSVVHAYSLCDALLARRLVPLGVRTAEHEILANLLREPGLSQQALARRCFSAKSHISGLLASMEERGWVRREPDPRDARAKCLFLQREGERLARRSVAAQAELVAIMAAPCSADELAAVLTAMEKVSAALQVQLDAPP